MGRVGSVGVKLSLCLPGGCSHGSNFGAWVLNANSHAAPMLHLVARRRDDFYTDHDPSLHKDLPTFASRSFNDKRCAKDCLQIPAPEFEGLLVADSLAQFR